MSTTTHNITIARNRSSEALPVELTLDWDGCTPEHIRELAAKHVIVKVQQPRSACKTDAMLRERFPETMTVRVADIEWGPKRGPRDPVAAAKRALDALTPEQRKGLWED